MSHGKAGFQMQAWGSADGVWRAMEEGAAASRWRPRATLIDAAAQCMAWTGFLGIPAMQVINLQTGDVAWRFGHETYEADAGAPIPLGEADDLVARALARSLMGIGDPRARAVVPASPAPAPIDQLTLDAV
jgi:hypothetical protein